MTKVDYIPTAREEARPPQPSVTAVVEQAYAQLEEFDALIAKLQAQIDDIYCPVRA